MPHSLRHMLTAFSACSYCIQISEGWRIGYMSAQLSRVVAWVTEALSPENIICHPRILCGNRTARKAEPVRPKLQPKVIALSEWLVFELVPHHGADKTCFQKCYASAYRYVVIMETDRRFNWQWFCACQVSMLFKQQTFSHVHDSFHIQSTHTWLHHGYYGESTL